ncbi:MULTISPECIES: hypothetical protein [unclassified Nocardioides]|uniref:hypothetical protein n=1 Tax=unclassified Nocardioides TaxID=2615069 RepID=UPI0009F127E8|nr:MULTISPECIES: hypothetical protein [unclassified Nocardioides]GAW47720.1 hypothetical protein PD653B2_0027 [Nocardioides sp. PD653-B2]GAW56850.1 hypothetical protein PD653_4290 [Nocardioides sp. PD653]
MLGHRTSLVAVLLLVAGLLTIGPPAQALVIYTWRFDQRPADLPATTVPAQTLVSASASLHDHGDSAHFQASVELGAVPDATTDATLHLAIGTVDGDACRTEWELVVSTLSPSGPAVRDGTSIRVASTLLDGGPFGPARCGSVTLLSPDTDATLDRLEGEAATGIADPGGRATVTQVLERGVTPGHWDRVWVRVRYAGTDADGVVVDGKGDGVRVKPHTDRQPLVDGDERWVPLRVRLVGDRRVRLSVTATPFGNLFRPGARPMTVWLVPRH